MVVFCSFHEPNIQLKSSSLRNQCFKCWLLHLTCEHFATRSNVMLKLYQPFSLKQFHLPFSRSLSICLGIESLYQKSRIHGGKDHNQICDFFCYYFVHSIRVRKSIFIFCVCEKGSSVYSVISVVFFFWESRAKWHRILLNFALYKFPSLFLLLLHLSSFMDSFFALSTL